MSDPARLGQRATAQDTSRWCFWPTRWPTLASCVAVLWRGQLFAVLLRHGLFVTQLMNHLADIGPDALSYLKFFGLMWMVVPAISGHPLLQFTNDHHYDAGS